VTQVTIEPVNRSAVQTTSRSPATSGTNATTAGGSSTASASAPLQPDVFALLNSVVSNQAAPNLPQRNSTAGQQSSQQQPSQQQQQRPQNQPAGQQEPWTETLRAFLAGGRAAGSTEATTANSTTSTNSTTPTPSADNAADGNPHDQLFVNLLSTFSTYLAQQSAGTGGNETIAALFNRVAPLFGEVGGEGGEGGDGSGSLLGMDGLLGELAGVVFNRMQFSELLSVYTRGDGQPLNFLRPHLRTFVDERLLMGREPSEENLREAIAPLVDDIVRETGRTFDDGGVAVNHPMPMEDDDDDDDDDDPPLPSLEEVTAGSQDVLRGATVVRGVDFHASLRQLYEARWLRLIATIYDDGVTDAAFGANIYAQLCQCVHDFVGLTLLLTSGEEDLRTIVSNIIRVGFRDHNPLVIEWIVRLCNQHLRDVVDGLHVNNPELNNFVVVGGSAGAISGATASSTTPNVKDEPMEEEGSVSMEEDEDWSEAKESLEEEKPGAKARGQSSTAGASTSALKKEDTPKKSKSTTPPATVDIKLPTEFKPTPVAAEAKPVKEKSPEKPPERPAPVGGAIPRAFPPPAAAPQPAPIPTRPGSWEPIVPPEWVAIIQQDVQRQQSQPTQPPFSDAYLNGMPANKRRKTLHLGSADAAAKKGASAAGDAASSTAPLTAALPDAVRRAIVATGARSTSGATPSEVARQVASTPEMEESFVSSVEATVRRRLTDDPDFKDNPQRFPATKQLFDEKDNGKK